MVTPVVYLWKKAPFIRVLVPFIIGVILQNYFQFRIRIIWVVLFSSVLVTVSYFVLPIFSRYKLSSLNGAGLSILFMSLGCLLTRQNDIRNDTNWFGKLYSSSAALVTLLERPIEKAKSYKAIASVDQLLKGDSVFNTKGKIIVYFKNDSLLPELDYGNQLIITRPLQEITNSGNPGGFDYKTWSLFQGITHQVFLKGNEYHVLPTTRRRVVRQFINRTRENVLDILRTNIKGEKERGLAEALLIGYKNDLDRTLVQSYSNTGVIHVIAISGLHLGLIYWLLTWLFKLLQKRKFRWLRPVFILAGLWLFSLLAGAQPSVLRSAIMFTCIVLGDHFDKRSSIFNSLALSALILLCINPHWLWDVGYQLSYAALLSIVIFMQPIYHLLYIKIKIVDLIWKLNAVTIAAQILTFPLGIYYFHQFPASFLFTNFVAVPLSSLILLLEILLCIVSFIQPVAMLSGRIVSWLIWLMNSYIGQIEKTPIALLGGFQISVMQAMLLLIVAMGLGAWLIEKNRLGFTWALFALFAFMVLRTVSFIKANKQQQLIVYNVPMKQAIDIVDGRKCLFIGDSDLLTNDLINSFHIKPSRILHRVESSTGLRHCYINDGLILYKNKRILILDETKVLSPPAKKVELDLLIISGNPKLYFKRLSELFQVKQVVFDGKCPAWKVNLWKEDCDSMQIPYHQVSEKGAFVMNLQ